MEKLKRKKAIIFISILVAVILLALSYVGFAYAYSNKISKGTYIAAVDLSGKNAKEAERSLNKKISANIEKALQLTLGDKTESVLPTEMALQPDVKKTVQALTKFTLNPTVLYERFKGNPNASLVLHKTNESAFDQAINHFQAKLGKKPLVEAGIKFEKTTPILTKSAKGEGFDVDKFLKSLSKYWFVKQKIQLSPKELLPTITDEKAQEVLEKVAKKLVASPMTANIETTSIVIEPQLIAESSSFVKEKNDLVLKVDGQIVKNKVTEKIPQILSHGQDAKIIIENNAPKIIPSQPGRNVDSNKLSENIVATATKEKDRNFTMTLSDMHPSFDTKAAEQLGVKEIIGEFSTLITGGSYKRKNLQVGASKVNNLLLKPGDIFSYNAHMRPVSAANGFVEGIAIIGNSYGWTYGGGLCNLSTTIYNAAFLGGMKEITHKSHSEYFSEYPLGRDATFWQDVVDMKFQNDTPYGVVMQAYVSGNRLHVRLWSTKHFEVKTTTGQKYNTIPFKTRTVTTSNCIDNASGSNGFSVDVWRGRYLNGKEHDQHKYTARYKPSDVVKCTNKQTKNNINDVRDDEVINDSGNPEGSSCGTRGCG